MSGEWKVTTSLQDPNLAVLMLGESLIPKENTLGTIGMYVS